jgi:hypothetical protein
MQQDLIDIPTCKCGQPCASHFYMTPNYDGDCSIDSFSPEIIYLDQCAECIWEIQMTEDALLNNNTSNNPIVDDLPF